jgi:hypothetical protein
MVVALGSGFYSMCRTVCKSFLSRLIVAAPKSRLGLVSRSFRHPCNSRNRRYPSVVELPLAMTLLTNTESDKQTRETRRPYDPQPSKQRNEERPEFYLEGLTATHQGHTVQMLLLFLAPRLETVDLALGKSLLPDNVLIELNSIYVPASSHGGSWGLQLFLLSCVLDAANAR